MAIILKNSRLNLTIDSNTIIGVMGSSYDKVLSSLEGNDVFYLDKKSYVSKNKVYSLFDLSNDKLINDLEKFELDKSFLSKRINELSHSEQKLLKYVLLITSKKKIIVIDEPFMDLDYYYKKKIILLINKLIKENKTVIIGSVNSNIIYKLCKKVLFISEDDYYYSDTSVFKKTKILEKYHIIMPDLVSFVTLAKNKKIKLGYSNDIRDLIKDVYRNVSKK